MRPLDEFLGKPRYFWANVRTIGQAVGYTRKKKISVPTFSQIRSKYQKLGLNPDTIADADDSPTELGDNLQAYFKARAKLLNEDVEPRLMDAERAGRCPSGKRA